MGIASFIVDDLTNAMQAMTREEIESLLRVKIPDDAVPFVMEFVNQLITEHGEKWIRENHTT